MICILICILLGSAGYILTSLSHSKHKRMLHQAAITSALHSTGCLWSCIGNHAYVNAFVWGLPIKRKEKQLFLVTKVHGRMRINFKKVKKSEEQSKEKNSKEKKERN